MALTICSTRWSLMPKKAFQHFEAQKIRRKYIDKPGKAEKRPLGIPTTLVLDAHMVQALKEDAVVNAVKAFADVALDYPVMAFVVH